MLGKPYDSQAELNPLSLFIRTASTFLYKKSYFGELYFSTDCAIANSSIYAMLGDRMLGLWGPLRRIQKRE